VLILLDRRRGREVGHLDWRVRLFAAGAVLALVGMYFRARWIIWIAIGVLLAGFFLRFLPEDGGDGGDGGEEDEDASPKRE